LPYVPTFPKKFELIELNEAGRKRTYSPEIYEQSTGKNVKDLWKEYVEKVLQPLQEGRKGIVPVTWFPNLMKYKKEFDESYAKLKPEPCPQTQPQQQRQGQGQGRQHPPQSEPQS